MRVLAYPAFAHREVQPYPYLLATALAREGLTVEELTRQRLLLNRHEVVHVHFPEYVLYHQSLRQAATRTITLCVLIAWARLRGAKLVWTVHNLEPHEPSHPRLSSLYWWAYTRQVDAFISLSQVGIEKVVERFPVLRHKPRAVVPHGHYRSEYPNEVSREEARRQLGIDPSAKVYLFFGQVRPYKSIPELILVFSQLDDPDAVLLVVGMPRDDSIRNRVAEAASHDERVRLHLEFVPSERAQVFMNAADLVVLPYRQVLNSGSALLALSFDRPVLVPALGALQELQDQVGPSWVHTYAGFLNSGILERGFEATRKPDGHVDLTDFEWDTLGARTAEFYRSILSRADQDQ